MDNTLNTSVPTRPIKKEGLISEDLEGMDEVIFVDSETGSNFSVNTLAAAILELCDGENSTEDIANIICETLNTEKQQTLSDTQTILSEFVAYGLIKTDE